MTVLTPKQEKFVRELVKGKSQRQAYKSAYNCDKTKDSVIDSKASILFSDGKVMERYNKLIKQSAERSVWTRERAENDLNRIKEECLKNLYKVTIDKDGNEIKAIDSRVATTAINSIKELNVMNGFNEQHIDISSEKEWDININVRSDDK